MSEFTNMMDFILSDPFMIVIMTLTSIITVLIILLEVVYLRKSKKISKKQEKFSQDIIQAYDFVTYERINNERKIDEITENIEKGQSLDKVAKQISDLQKEIRESKSRIIENTGFDNKVEELIQEHHEQAISQSKWQFRISVGASILGFVILIVFAFKTNNVQWYEYVVKFVPGIISEAISVLFFTQSKETRERASDFLNRLREDRQYAKSINLVESIEDEKLRSSIKAEIALNMCSIKTDDKSNGKKKSWFFESK